MEEERGMANPMDSDRPGNLSKERLGSIDVSFETRNKRERHEKNGSGKHSGNG